LLLVLAGEVELDLPSTEAMRLQPGEFVYYPQGFAHTLRTTSDEAANYVMFKWRGEQETGAAALPFARFRTAAAGVLFEGPTEYLRKLHAHVTVLEPGRGYEPHVDAYDVAIVLLEGEVETIGGRGRPHDVIFYRAGEAHGMRCLGDAPARYLVFEFHGRTWLGTRQLRNPRLRAKLGHVLRRARAAQRRRAASLRVPKRRPRQASNRLLGRSG
jgi:quercetin dioxygenase-like cupin family protein